MNASSPRTDPIFVVDDEEMVGRIVHDLLEMHGYHPVFFQNPQAALQAFAEANPKPRLVITDFVMSPFNGIELIERCRQIDPQLRTILYSGSSAEDIFRCWPQPAGSIPPQTISAAHPAQYRPGSAGQLNASRAGLKNGVGTFRRRSRPRPRPRIILKDRRRARARGRRRAIPEFSDRRLALQRHFGELTTDCTNCTDGGFRPISPSRSPPLRAGGREDP